MIFYRPAWVKATGSVLATILLQRILYRWDKNGSRPFYKFKEPCQHELYRPGDSWTEELGFDREEFDSALKEIAVKQSEKTKSEKKAMVEYWTDINRVTYYTINPTELNTNLEIIYPNPNPTSQPNEDVYVKSERDFTKNLKGDLKYKQRLTNKDKNDGGGNKSQAGKPYVKKESSSLPLPEKQSIPAAVIETILVTLVALVPDEMKQPTVIAKIKNAISRGVDVSRIRGCILYTNDESDRKSYKQYGFSLRRCIDGKCGEKYNKEGPSQKTKKIVR